MIVNAFNAVRNGAVRVAKTPYIGAPITGAVGLTAATGAGVGLVSLFKGLFGKAATAESSIVGSALSGIGGFFKELWGPIGDALATPMVGGISIGTVAVTGGILGAMWKFLSSPIARENVKLAAMEAGTTGALRVGKALNKSI